MSEDEELDRPHTITKRQMTMILREAFERGRNFERKKLASERPDPEDSELDADDLLPRELVPQYAQYFSADADGTYLNIHEGFGMKPMEFREASGLEPEHRPPDGGDPNDPGFWNIHWRKSEQTQPQPRRQYSGLVRLLSEALPEIRFSSDVA